jgi:hypothetical protein
MMFVDRHLTCEISASSFHPNRHGDGLPSATYLNARAHGRFGIANEAREVHHDGNDRLDSDVKTESEWFDESCTDTQKNTSTMNAVAIEVSPFQVFIDYLINKIFQIPLWCGSVDTTGSSVDAH